MRLFGRLFAKDDISDDDLLETMVSADIAPDVAEEIIRKAKKSSLKEVLTDYAKKLELTKIPGMKSVLVVGVNGAGKTTFIGKLANKLTNSGYKVIIGSGDTFRAASNEQLSMWAERAGAEFISGTEPAAVAYKATEAALNSTGLAIIDTAGRLHSRSDLMAELSKIVRVMKKLEEHQPGKILLVLDGTTGQNALAQIESFGKVVPLSGLVITKMDGTGKAGFLITYAAREKNPLPVYYVSEGENISDISVFEAGRFVKKLTLGI